MYINDNLQVAQLSLGNIAASGQIGTAANTVDKFSDFLITQTVTGVLATLPIPIHLTGVRS